MEDNAGPETRAAARPTAIAFVCPICDKRHSDIRALTLLKCDDCGSIRQIAQFCTRLKEDNSNYMAVRPLPGRRYVVVVKLIFHYSLFVGHIGEKDTYYDRFCYETRPLAAKAYAAWNGRGEPTGWHRHPMTGRRRPGGDPAKEYIES